MSDEAWRTIRAHPGQFARACLRRAVSFWNIVPNVRSDASLSLPAFRLVGAYYCILFTAFAGGLACVLSGRVCRSHWLSPVLLIAGFALVHLLYWSDARMRAPVTPEIALLAACGAEQLWLAATRRRASE
jgi:hypothetical protein